MASQQQPQNYHSVPVGLIICLFGGAVLFVMWFANHRGLVTGWVWFEWALLQPFRYLTALFSSEAASASNQLAQFASARVACPKVVSDPNAVQYGTLAFCSDWKQNWKSGWAAATYVGSYWRWVLAAVCGYFIYKHWNDPLKRFKGEMTVPNFLETQSRHWKSIVPFLKRDLNVTPDPQYAESLEPFELAAKERVVVQKKFINKEAERVLLKQLGPKFKIDQMDDIEKALFVCFGLRILRKADESRKIFAAINESMRGNKPADLSFALNHFERISKDAKVLGAIKGHYYTNTVLFEMLVRACEFGGVLPPSDFLGWLKPAKRSLWYGLNRAPATYMLDIAAFSEGLQIVAQWQVESVAKNNGLSMSEPYFDRSIVAWKESLYKAGYIDEEVENINASALASKKKKAKKIEVERGTPSGRRATAGRF